MLGRSTAERSEDQKRGQKPDMWAQTVLSHQHGSGLVQPPLQLQPGAALLLVRKSAPSHEEPAAMICSGAGTLEPAQTSYLGLGCHCLEAKIKLGGKPDSSLCRCVQKQNDGYSSTARSSWLRHLPHCTHQQSARLCASFGG